MSLSTLPLSYCTNVHPGRTLAEVEAGLATYTARLRERLGGPVAAGLWLARPVVDELLESRGRLEAFASRLAEHRLACYTLNAFPFGDFHSERVKEQVYLPDWSQRRRRDYTFDCARVLAELMPAGTEGSISTVPLGFKELPHRADFLDRSVEQLIELALTLDELYDETGRLVRLAIEPEPFCVLETTAETVSFFQRLRERAAESDALAPVERFVGVCYDVCHQAVEFEDVDASIAALDAADIRINKVHITCALELPHPAENRAGREALAEYVEPRYLHQAFARLSTGEVLRAVDLTRELALNPEGRFQSAEMWRVHFHVPVDSESLGPLATTRRELAQALAAVKALSYAPHLEVETYTWEVLPGCRRADLVDGLSRELAATRRLLDGL
jgi:sugar phosphate isomerase/epimerase